VREDAKLKRPEALRKQRLAKVLAVQRKFLIRKVERQLKL
jgi:hypothetical protein